MHSRCLAILAAALWAPALRAQPRPPAACGQYQTAVQADSTNLDAAASLGQCSVRDYEMIAPGGDSTRLVFRSSWSAALRALRRAVALDPGYSRAYRPLFAILFAETRDGCSSVTGECWYVSPVARDGDSVITIPRRVRLNVPGVDTYAEVVEESQANRRASLTEARELAERWARVAPNDRRPHQYRGQALLGLGEYSAASTELELAASLGTPESRRALFWDRFEALVKSDQGAEARRVLDEVVSDPGRDYRSSPRLDDSQPQRAPGAISTTAGGFGSRPPVSRTDRFAGAQPPGAPSTSGGVRRASLSRRHGRRSARAGGDGFGHRAKRRHDENPAGWTSTPRIGEVSSGRGRHGWRRGAASGDRANPAPSPAAIQLRPDVQ